MNKLTLELKLELAAAAGCAIILAIGAYAENILATLLAGICLGILGQRWLRRVGQGTPTSREPAEAWTPPRAEPTPVTVPVQRPTAPRREKARPARARGALNDPAVFVDAMIDDGRYALLLRPEVVPNLSPGQLQRAIAALHEEMAFVPEGDVKLGLADGHTDEDTAPHHATSIFIDRYPITNEAYKLFLDDGGYQNEEYWDDGVFSGVANFVDRTGCPGPRFWQHGTYSTGMADHPVVGISWFEAAACARWMGKRLPLGPEWVKAAAWPVTGPDGQIQQRKYPWGDRFGEGMANTWSSGVGSTVSVYDFENGASMSGGHQFVGNVWEWMADDTRIAHQEVDAARVHRVKALRGGAFDTYFESQATCHFESGDDPFARKHNIGFRCVVTADELAQQVRQQDRERSGDRTRDNAAAATSHA